VVRTGNAKENDMKKFLVEYVRWENKVENVVVWERGQKYGSSHQEYLLEAEGLGVFAVVTAWKGEGFEAWVLVRPSAGDVKATKKPVAALRQAIVAAIARRRAAIDAGHEIRYEPNPAEVGNG
jgi:hypothetical protein